MPERSADRGRRRRQNGPLRAGQMRIKRPRRHILAKWCDSYFTQLPENAIENIIRFTSLRPRSPNWKAYVSPEDVLNFARANYDLFLAVRPMFTSLETNISDDEEMRGLRIIGTGDGSRRFFPRIAYALEENLTAISIRRATFPISWTFSLVFKCPSLRSLSITKLPPGLSLPLAEILSVHCGTLERLEICGSYSCEQEIEAIARFGHGLKILQLKVDHLWSGLFSVRETVGETLEEVFVPSTYGLSSFDLCSLQKNWKRIRTISVLKLPSRFHILFENLCVRLGGQLACLNMENCALDSNAFGRIADACENIRINISEEQGCSSRVLYEMGAQSCRVTIGKNTAQDSGYHSKYLEKASERCKNLNGITLNDFIPEHAFRALLFYPKPFLVDFKATIREIIDVEFVFKALAKSSSSLEEFRFHGSIPSMSVFEAFLEASPFLKNVYLRDNQDVCHCHEASMWEIDLDEEEVTYDLDWGYVLRLLLQRRLIKEISLSCSKRYPLCGQDLFDAECVLA